MTRRTKIIIVVIALATSFAVGRYTVSEKVRIETKIVEVEKKTDNKKRDEVKKKNTKTTVTETDKPDGTKTITTETTDTGVDTSTDTEVATDSTNKASDTIKEVTKGESKVTLSALGGIDFTNGHYVFGASVTRPILGPLTLGIWGLTDMTAGISLGLQF